MALSSALSIRPLTCAGVHARSTHVRTTYTGVLNLRQRIRVRAGDADDQTVTKEASLEKELSKIAKQTASTFAPRSSTAQKNPAFKGSGLYTVFEAQAWVSLFVGALLSFNILLPTDEPSIPRLLGMWSVWMFTVPSLRARECTPTEKDALNLLFLAIPLLNVTLPLLWKSFPFVFTADVVAMFGTFYWKGVWREVYGIPIGGTAAVAELDDKGPPSE